MFFAIFVIFAFTLLFFYNYKKHNYWAERGVYSPPSIPILGHMSMTFFDYPWEAFDKVYKKSKRYGFAGFYEFFNPKFAAFTPELVRQITVKDFDHFVDRRTLEMKSKNDKVLKDMLSNATGDHWKFLRNILTPSFTSGKLKAMFPIVSGIGDDLVSQVKKSSKSDPSTSVDMQIVCGRYALDVVASTAFGIEGKGLVEGEDSEFYKLVVSLNQLSVVTSMKFFVMIMSPKLFEILGLSFFGDKNIKLVNLVKKALDIRRQQSQSARRGDFVDLILEANDKADKGEIKKHEFTEDSMIAQSVLFLLAGFDTISNTLAFLINDLAKYPEEQKKVRDELSALVADGGFTYQSIMEAKYLDAFICESMRLTPIAHFMERKCTQNYRVPERDLMIMKEQIVTIPVWSLHKDPEYWENPSEFRPSRFLPENKDKIVPYTYLPFGSGPRNCIGNRFALMEMKIAVAKLILNFEVSHPFGFEVKLLKTPQTLRPDSNGVQINFKEIS